MNEEIKVKKMKRKVLLLVITIIFVNMIMYLNYFRKSHRVDEVKLGKNLSQHVGEIIEGRKISQNVDINGNRLLGLDIMFSTFNRVNYGTTTIQIKEKDKLIYQTQLNNNTIRDNYVHTIKFDKPLKVNNKNINIIIIGNAKINNGVTVWIDKDVNTSHVYLNHEKIGGALVMNILQETEIDGFKILYINIAFIIINFFLYKLMKFLTEIESRCV